MIPIILDEDTARTVVLALSDQVGEAAHRMTLELIDGGDPGFRGWIRDEIRTLLDVIDDIEEGLPDDESDATGVDDDTERADVEAAA